MQNTPTNNREDIEKLKESIELIINRIDSVAFSLANKVDETFPGDIFGLDKYEHCKHLESETQNIGESMGLNEEEILLLSVVFKGHDVGRHQEALNRLDTLRSGVRHGILGVNILNETNALDGISEEQKEAILGAVQYHSEKLVDLDSKSLGYKLCYVLRDFDKKEIIDDEKYLQTEGMFEQINKHYFGGELKPEHKEIISKMLSGEEITVTEDNEITKNLISVMNDGINPVTLEEFLNQEATTVQDIKYSYSTYMLNSISLMFDIKNNAVLEGFIKSEMFKERLRFIESRVDEITYKKIVSCIQDYLTKRFGKEDIDVLKEGFNSDIINIIK